tara:strand:+ start:659 stop:1021 length:363 start_codon:yes stop_codon:yes gene_type:complete
MALDNSPSIRRGTSGSEGSDLRPGYRYDIDLRRVDEEERDIVDRLNAKQESIERRVKAAKAAGKFRNKRLIDQPTIGGKTPRSQASIQGTALPSMGEAFGPVGGTKYADKPRPFSGEVFY